MNSKPFFIKATEDYNDFDNSVPAYYFRRTFTSEAKKSVTLRIAVCGFYELFFNGEKITRGFLCPYISNPDDIVYFDEYTLELKKGKNAIGVLLGNGFQNNPGGHIWLFDKAEFRSSPKFALSVYDRNELMLDSSEGFKIAPSPIRSDDYRFGEFYDAQYEIEDWNEIEFDDSDWTPALSAAAPKGELRLADVPPIIKECEIKPTDIIPCEDGGYIYDFGISNAGVCRLTVNGHKGQRIELRHADSLQNGDLDLGQVWFERDLWERDKKIVHRDVYICKGVGTEVYEPTFTYHGFRFVKVNGITKEQATKELLTYLVYHTELSTRADFECSDEIATTLQVLTRRSIISNFHHFPTDCPQREKNGWTADAALTCEAALLNYNPERSYREWMRNIRKAQAASGALPGIVPTAGWGFDWGNGPAWDCVLAYLPYYVYLYRGSTEIISESVDSFISYLSYLRSRTDERGLLEIGLGDWCHIGRIPPKAPLILTDSIMAMDISEKMALMLDAVNLGDKADFARSESEKYRNAIRENLIDFNTMLAAGECQSSQAMSLYYGVFDNSEEDAAFERLLELIHAYDDHIDLGVLGGRVIFHVLTRFGHSDLAFKMITREDFPSYGNWVKRGATTLWEDFFPEKSSSMNHHFWGDISAWFIKRVVGIQLNPQRHNVNEVKIAPSFVKALDHASAYHIAPKGKISVCWKRENGRIILDVEIPDGINATASLPSPYRFENGEGEMAVVSGRYTVV